MKSVFAKSRPRVAVTIQNSGTDDVSQLTNIRLSAKVKSADSPLFILNCEPYIIAFPTLLLCHSMGSMGTKYLSV